MNPLSIGIGIALFGLKMMTNQKVVARTKELVRRIDKEDMSGTAKTDHVMKELGNFFSDIVPIILEMVIKIAVLDMQNENGVLQTKLNDMKKVASDGKA